MKYQTEYQISDSLSQQMKNYFIKKKIYFLIYKLTLKKKFSKIFEHVYVFLGDHDVY